MKKTTPIKVFAIAILHFAFPFLYFTAHGAVIEQVIVRQQWPWSTDVKVEYKVSGVTSPVNIGVRAFNGNEELDSSRLEASITGDRFGISKDGVGSFVIDPVKAFGTASVALANFKVKLSLAEATANINEVIYKVFDLSTGACKDITRADFFNGKVEDGDYVTDYTSLNSRALTPTFDMVGDVLIWTGVTNNVKYKTTHLVMRKIPAANKVWRMGALPAETGYRAATETNHLVKLTRDYYMGVTGVKPPTTTIRHGRPSRKSGRRPATVPSVCQHPHNGNLPVGRVLQRDCIPGAPSVPAVFGREMMEMSPFWDGSPEMPRLRSMPSDSSCPMHLASMIRLATCGNGRRTNILRMTHMSRRSAPDGSQATLWSIHSTLRRIPNLSGVVAPTTATVHMFVAQSVSRSTTGHLEPITACAWR